MKLGLIGITDSIAMVTKKMKPILPSTGFYSMGMIIDVIPIRAIQDQDVNQAFYESKVLEMGTRKELYKCPIAGLSLSQKIHVTDGMAAFAIDQSQNIGHKMCKVLTSQYRMKTVYYRIKQAVQWHHSPPFVMAVMIEGK
jgi:hypothetical protein